MASGERPRPLVVVISALELLFLAGAAVLLAANLLTYIDETIGVALLVIVSYVVLRFIPPRQRLTGQLLLVSLWLSLVAGEAVVRSMGDRLRGYLYTELPECFVWLDDDVLPFIYKPGGRCAGENRHVTEGRICDDPHTVEKPPGTFRILVVGDSTSLFADPYDALYHQRLEAALAAEPPAGWTVEVVNGAHEGYNAVQEIEFLERYTIRYDPDLLLVAYTLNDPYPGVYAWRRARSRLLRLAGILVSSASLGRGYETYEGLHADPALWEPVVASYHRLRDLAAQRGIPIVAFVVPDFAPGSTLVDVYAQVEGLLRAIGAHVLDVHSELTDADRVTYHDPPDTMHPNEAFHAHLAERLLAFLRQERLLPTTPPPTPGAASPSSATPARPASGP